MKYLATNGLGRRTSAYEIATFVVDDVAHYTALGTTMITSQQSEPPDSSKAPGDTNTTALLRVEGIRAGYGKKEILHGVDLSINAGEIVVLAGANGAGKSTFLKVLAGLLKPTAGIVRWAGKDVTTLPTYRRSRLGVGYLLQGGEVFPSLTAQENLGIAVGDRFQNSSALEPVLGLFPPLRMKLQQRAGMLSGGERQMLSIAMVLVTRPRLLLLDEPTAALAPSLATETLRRIRQHCEQQSIAALLVEQRLRDALHIANRAVALVLGRLVQETADPSRWVSSPDLAATLLPSMKPPIEDDGQSQISLKS